MDGGASPWRAPAYSAEWAAGAFGLVRDWLAPRLVGADIASGEQLQRALASVRGNYFAKASLRSGLVGSARAVPGAPLWQVIGGQRTPWLWERILG